MAIAEQKTIFVVDDNEDFVTVITGILEGHGFRVESAFNGEDLFKLLEDKKPNLIVLDIVMPKMDGLEILTRLREDPETAAIPVILLTAKGQYRDVLLGYKLGTDYYISKPFTSTQLLNGVNMVLGGGHP